MHCQCRLFDTVDAVSATPEHEYFKPVVYCGAIIIVAIIAALTLLAVLGKDSTEISRLINTAFNFAGLLLGGGGLVYGRLAATRAGQAAEQTNGGMEERITAAVHRALEEERRISANPSLSRLGSPRPSIQPTDLVGGTEGSR